MLQSPGRSVRGCARLPTPRWHPCRRVCSRILQPTHASQSPVQRLVTWLEEQGAEGTDRVHVWEASPGERGLYTKQEFGAVDVILRLPLSAALFEVPPPPGDTATPPPPPGAASVPTAEAPSSAAADTFGQAHEARGSAVPTAPVAFGLHVSATARLAARLLREVAAGPASFWAPYIACLPARPPCLLLTGGTPLPNGRRLVDELEYEPLAAALVSYERLAAEQYYAVRCAGQLPEGATLEVFKWALAVVGSRCLGVELLLLALMTQPPEPQLQQQQQQQQHDSPPHTTSAPQSPVPYGLTGSRACDSAGGQHAGGDTAEVAASEEQLQQQAQQHQAQQSALRTQQAGVKGSKGGTDEDGFGEGAAEGLLRLLLLTAAVKDAGEAPAQDAAAGDAHGSGQQPAAASGSAGRGISGRQEANVDASGGRCGSETRCLEQGVGARGVGPGGGSAGGVPEWQVRILVPLLDFMNHGSLEERGSSSSSQAGRNSHSWPLPGRSAAEATSCSTPGTSQLSVAPTANVRWAVRPPCTASAGPVSTCAGSNSSGDDHASTASTCSSSSSDKGPNTSSSSSTNKSTSSSIRMTDTWHVEVAATRPIRAGEQLLLCYDPSDTHTLNDAFALHYGFVPPLAHHDAVQLYGSMEEAVRWYEQGYGGGAASSGGGGKGRRAAAAAAVGGAPGSTAPPVMLTTGGVVTQGLQTTFHSLAQLASPTSSGPGAKAAAVAAAASGHAAASAAGPDAQPVAAAAVHGSPSVAARAAANGSVAAQAAAHGSAAPQAVAHGSAAAAAQAAARRAVAQRCRQLLSAMTPLSHDLRRLRDAASADGQRTLYRQQQQQQQESPGESEQGCAGDKQQSIAVASVGGNVGEPGASSVHVPSQPYPSSTDWQYVMDAYRTAVLQSGCTELYELAGIEVGGEERAGSKGRGGAAGEAGEAMEGCLSPGVLQQLQQHHQHQHQQLEQEARSNGETECLSALEHFALVYRVNKKLIMWRWILAELVSGGSDVRGAA